jgi:hypothetical protein
LAHTGAINGWNAIADFIPTKQIGVVALCSCDPSDADMGNFGFVLLHLTGIENLIGESDCRIHTTPSPPQMLSLTYGKEHVNKIGPAPVFASCGISPSPYFSLNLICFIFSNVIS